MRRAWLLALLLVPALAPAQDVPPTPGTGEVTFDNEFINSAECSGTGNIALSWVVAITTGAGSFDPNGRMEVLATDEDFTGPGSGGAECPVDGTPTSRVVGVVDTIDNPSDATETERSYLAKAFVDAAGVGDGCTTDASIWVCVQFYDSDDVKTGFAKGRTTLKLRFGKPLAPTGVSAPGGEQSLVVSFQDPNDPDADEYRIVAESVLDPTLATTGVDPLDPLPHEITVSGTSDNRLRGLQNNVVYKVVVLAQDEADNESDPSLAVTGMPQPVNDFWELYSSLGGREQGGCSGGPAGIVSLAVAAGLVAALRRRK